MALVCDSKSSPSSEVLPPDFQETKSNGDPGEDSTHLEPQTFSSDDKMEEIDLEDGEIEDDEEEQGLPEQPQEAQEPPEELQNGPSPSKSDKSDKVVKKVEMEVPIVVLSPSLSEKSVEKHSRKGKERDSSRDRLRKSKKEAKKERKEEKAHRRMTEAERSILHLRKKEKLLRERDKWSKKDPDGLDDDFAKNIEKTLATILHKKEKEMAALNSGNEEELKEEKKGKKRKKHDKDRDRTKAKHKRPNTESPRTSELDEIEMLNVRSGSPGGGQPHPDSMGPLGPMIGPLNQKRSRSPSSESFDEEEFSGEDRDERLGRRRFNNRDNRDRGPNNRDRNWRQNNKKDNRNERGIRQNNRRDRDMRRGHENSPQQNKLELQDSQGVCVFYMQGKCQKSDCPYSHEVSPPMKLELCKFYLMDCCAKGDNCSYMHGEFPCKFYHTGLLCSQGDDCKFAHGAPLTEGLKQILFKHIETAPRDILGGFPRLSREEALNLINVTQKKLKDEYSGEGAAAGGGPVDEEQDLLKGGIPSLFDLNVPIPPELAQGLDSDIILPPPKLEKKQPKVTRWHQKDDPNFGSQFSYGTDQDMRFTSNGDIDMRTLPTLSASNSQASLNSNNSSQDGATDSLSIMDYQTDFSNVISPSKKDVDIRQQNIGTINYSKDIDIRQPISFALKAKDVDQRPHLMASTVFGQAEEEVVDGEKMEDKPSEAQTSGKVSNIGLSQSTMDLIARITAKNPTDLNSIPVPQTDYKPISTGEDQLQNDGDQEKVVDTDNINWYSDDDDDDEPKLTIKVEDEDNRRDSVGKEDEHPNFEEGKNDMETDPFIPDIKPTDIVGKLGDLSKIDISAEVTKLLTSMSQSKFASPKQESPSNSAKASFGLDPRMTAKEEKRRDSSSSQDSFSSRTERRSSQDLIDPRLSRDFRESRNDPRDGRDPRESPRLPRESRDARGSRESAKDPRGSKDTKEKERKDPRMGLTAMEDPRSRRKGSTEEKAKKSGKLSIYEQGGLDMEAALNDIDPDEFKSSLRPDIDLRNLTLPFKGMQNYTPATEIDASLNSHPPILWKLAVVEVPRPDYTGLKLSVNDAEKTGDPRLKKLFRLSSIEDSPMSPKASMVDVGRSAGVRVDPRIKKSDEKPSTVTSEPSPITYNQQLTILQSSQFYQSLTSNQKLMLNQELADRYDQNTGADPFLFSLLSNLNLLPGGALGNVANSVQSMIPNLQNQINAASLPILAAAQQVPLGQQGLLGAAPGIPNMPVDFPMNFDPRNGGLLGNGPPPGMFGNPGYPPMDGGYNMPNDDFYPGPDHPPQGGGNFRGGFHHNNNERNFNNRDNRRRGGRNNFNNRNNRDFKNNRNRGGRGRQNRHHSPD